ncbi:PIG-L deacetylase family protein [Catalinimonas niigatensis]|uniref:PIG-L deacetylase family protein n=1 Tax=Catalinimonas niigatensis TaxID=1397264 RepID=UPI002665C2E8|nr:PIG-L family deacetylase [Catalinimonas niigatensis]WPP48979.1 PIG-L family deacetylase [Catalinimonas niigatensis]
MNAKYRSSLLFLVFFLTYHFATFAQAPDKLSAAEIQLALKKLNTLGSALYIAAHPDDENQVVIGYLSQTKLMNTGYLALTRGDGGQNLIGPEIRERLGVVRSQELIQARSVDGSKQFFSRAIDFGYSKTADETLALWDKDKILADVVWVIRKFQPDVMITRFPPDERAGHGHHTTSGILAAEAFDLAADPQAFPEQLEYVDVWQPTRLVFNESSWMTEDIEKTSVGNDSILSLDLGVYNPLLGKSVTEIAAESRSKHQSQGFGATGSRGKNMEYFRHVKGKMAEDGLFDDINTSWARVEGGEKVGQLLAQAYTAFRPENPAAAVPKLMEASEALNKLKDGYWKKVKREELDRVIRASLGLYLEVRSGTNALSRSFRSNNRSGIAEYSATPGDSVVLNVEVINRSAVPVQLKSVTFTSIDKDTTINTILDNNRALTYSTEVLIPQDMPYSGPYWLREPHDGFSFTVDDQQLIGMDDTPPAIEAIFNLTIDGKPLDITTPVIYKYNDARIGETYRPFVITPPVFLEVEGDVHVFAEQEAKPIRVSIKAGKSDVSGTVSLQLPAGWSSDPLSYDYAITQKGQEKEFVFNVLPPAGQSVGEIKAVAEQNGQAYDQSMLTIAYEHIPTQTLFPTASAQLVKLDIRKEGETIGYIMGAGDEVPEALEQIGYQVVTLGSHNMSMDQLSSFDAIMIGIRAYNTVDWLRYHNEKLLQYVENGGTLITQYNTGHMLLTQNFAPYELKISRDRVADETAEVRFLQKDHPILNTPNKISKQDFEHWVQERGLYFPDEWDKEQFKAILSINDPGEGPKEGALLVAKYGKGYYIYSGLSFFRELPAGVPGAYRLLTNMISIGKGPETGR